MITNSQNQRRFLVCYEWYSTWISFLYGEMDLCPSRIDNS